ncbi:hypothetical protein CBL_05561 [Carabus blaptoides fortunei]
MAHKGIGKQKRRRVVLLYASLDIAVSFSHCDEARVALTLFNKHIARDVLCLLCKGGDHENKYQLCSVAGTLMYCSLCGIIVDKLNDCKFLGHFQQIVQTFLMPFQISSTTSVNPWWPLHEVVAKLMLALTKQYFKRDFRVQHKSIVELKRKDRSWHQIYPKRMVTISSTNANSLQTVRTRGKSHAVHNQLLDHYLSRTSFDVLPLKIRLQALYHRHLSVSLWPASLLSDERDHQLRREPLIPITRITG